MKKSILIISLSNLDTDPRVRRQIDCLRERYKVVTVGFRSSGFNNVTHFEMVKNPLDIRKKVLSLAELELGRYEKYYWKIYNYSEVLENLKDPFFDLVIANDVNSLPFTAMLSANTKLLVDAHEYSPRQYEDRLKWKLVFQRYVKYLCREYLPLASEMITVCDGISCEYERVYGVKSRVVVNAPRYHDLEPSQIEQETIRLVHHGAASPSRQIELMLKMMHFMDRRYHLYLMLIPVGDGSYLRYLTNKYRSNHNIHFLDPVSPDDIVGSINEYDIGVYLLPPRNFNSAHALPNKFFEFIQARLAIAIGPSSEMVRYVKRYDLGLVSPDFKPSSLARGILKLSRKKIMYYKSQSHKHAYELSAARSMALFSDIVDGLILGSQN